MKNNSFYEVSGIQDKSIKSSTHKANYLSKTGNFNIPIKSLKVAKNNMSLSQEDSEILGKIINGIEKSNKLLFPWTPQEAFYCNQIEDINRKVLYLIYRYKFKVYPVKRILSDFPIHVLLEPAGICNLRCVMCYQSDKTFTGDNLKKNSNKNYMGMMDYNLFTKVIDECDQEGCNAISLGSRGEPMLNKNFNKMLNYINEKKNFFDVKINTNGSALNEKNCHTILSSNVNILVISCEGEYKELYEKIRLGGNFDKLVKNVELLRYIREKHYKDSKLEIRISGVLFHKDQHREPFLDFWKNYADVVSYVKAQIRWDTYNNEIIKEKNNECDFLWEKLYVWWDGVTNPCDEDYKSMLSPGNAKHETIKNIWKSHKLQNLRELHLNGKRNTVLPCDRCGV
tara:strand:- start:2256 stop:3446 length:1191 start_codon:yes stop_codon:yes gene_type:complete